MVRDLKTYQDYAMVQDSSLNPLEWWKEREARMPFISVVARALRIAPGQI